MKNRFKKITCVLIAIMSLSTLFSLTTSAISLSYSGASASNSTGASASTSGFRISYSTAIENICGYRFSVVTSAGTPKSGTKVGNVFLTNSHEGNTAYSSGQRFIISSGNVANKKQLANGTKVSSSTTKQSCDYKSDSCGFYSAPPLDPAVMGNWIKNTTKDYLNLQRVYAVCGTNLANATASDYVLIEPLYWVKLANVGTSVTPTELAVYGANVSGGDGYNGTNGNLYNAGSGTLWNLCNYINLKFPNTLYVSSKTDIYNAVTISTSTRYTYRQIIQNGYGCSVLTVKNLLTSYYLDVNGLLNGQGSGNITGFGTCDVYINNVLVANDVSDYYTAHVKGSSYSIRDIKALSGKTYNGVSSGSLTGTISSNTAVCLSFSDAFIDTIGHWAWGFNGNGNNGNKNAFNLKDVTFTKKAGDVFSLTKDNAVTIPNGFCLENDYGTSSVDGKWTNYIFGTSITQKAERMWFEYGYQPIEYNITYELNGGKNHSSNPTSYNVLYGKTLYSPTKAGCEFLGWMREFANSDITLSARNHDYNYYNVLNNIEPGTQYDITIENAKVTVGSASEFSCIIFDFTDNKTLVSTKNTFGNDITFSITCPSTANTSHDIQILIYSGVMGTTKDIGTTYTNVKISYYMDNINAGCGSAFSSPSNLYSELAKRTTGDIKLIAIWNHNEGIVIVPIEPNAPYRENTTVMSSFWLVNISSMDYIPSTGAKVVFGVYNSSGVTIASEIQSFVSPKDDKNLAYIKWDVPDGYASSDVTVKAHILENGNEYSNVENDYTIVAFDIFKTPDTSYKEKAPESFSVPTSAFDNDAKARWWQWEYSGGTFVKKEYAVSNSANDLLLSTDTNPTAFYQSGKLNMKSGYGFGCSFLPSMNNISGYETTSKVKCVAPQYFYSLFPEFNYDYGIDKCRSYETVSGKKVFVNADKQLRQHFTPIYFPDGDYNFQVVLSDCWTPAGMLTSYKTMTININGNMFDDWSIGRKN